MPGFYYVVEFEIVCLFDFLQYWDSRLEHAEQEEHPFKEIQAKIDARTRKSMIKKLVSGATTRLQEEAEELAEWATEYVAKEQVFEDLSNAIEAACEASSAEKESTPRAALAPKEKVAENEGSPEIASSPKHRILIYRPTNLKLVIEILQPELTNERIRLKNVEGSINLAEEIVARIEARNYETEQEIVVDRNLKVVIEPGYFKGKTITFERGSACKWTLSKSKEFRFIQSEAKLHPDIDKITRNQENLVKYPVTFKLVRSAGDNVSGDTVQYCKAQLNVEFALPKIRFDVTRPYFPRKGEQFDVTFDVKCKSISSLDYEIPVKVVCYPGADFSALSSTEKAISKKLNIQVSQNKGGRKGTTHNEKSNTAKFTLIAKRASFPGYYNSAYFEFFVGDHQEAVQEWRLNITTLPNLMDTFVAGGTGLLGVLSVAYPDMFPAITQGLSIANLEIIPATIYLVYRVLNWSRKT